MSSAVVKTKTRDFSLGFCDLPARVQGLYSGCKFGVSLDGDGSLEGNQKWS